MSLNLKNRLYQRYNHVKINKNATAILYLKSESLYFRDTHCSRHFNLAILLNREIREINVSRKFHVIRYFCYIKIYPLTRFLLLCYLFQLMVSPSCVSEYGGTPIWEGRGCSLKNWIFKPLRRPLWRGSSFYWMPKRYHLKRNRLDYQPLIRKGARASRPDWRDRRKSTLKTIVVIIVSSSEA